MPNLFNLFKQGDIVSTDFDAAGIMIGVVVSSAHPMSIVVCIRWIVAPLDWYYNHPRESYYNHPGPAYPPCDAYVSPERLQLVGHCDE